MAPPGPARRSKADHELVQEFERLREERGMTQGAVARQLGRQQAWYSRMKSGGLALTDPMRSQMRAVIDRWREHSSYSAYVDLRRELCGRFRDGDPNVVFVLGAGTETWGERIGWAELGHKLLERAQDELANTGPLLQALADEHGLATPSEPPEPLEVSSQLTTDMIADFLYRNDLAREFVVDEMRKILGPEGDFLPPPFLGHQLLAGFLRNGLCDHLLSFNVNSSLDHVLQTELGREGEAYDCIVTVDDPRADQEPDKPRLIKIHGSLDTRTSLRFGDRIPRNLSRALDNTVLSAAKARNGRTILVSLGFSFKHRGFAEWVRSRINDIDRIFVVRRRNEPTPLELGDTTGDLADRVRILSTDEIGLGTSLAVDHLVWALARDLDEELREKVEGAFPYEPLPPISRAIILAYLFGRPFDAPPSTQRSLVFRNDHDPRLRFRAELLLRLAKGKGMLTTTSLANDPRIQPILRHMKAEEIQEEMNHFLERSPDPAATATWFSRARSRDELASALFREPEENDDSFAFRQRSPKVERVDDQHVSVPQSDDDRQKIGLQKQRSKESFLRQHVDKLFESSDIDVTPHVDPQIPWIFSSDATPIETQHQLGKAVQRLIGRRWTHLVAVTDWGTWFPARLDGLGDDRTLIAIEPAELGLESWAFHREAIPRPLEHDGRSRFLWQIPAWEINRHLLLVFGDDGFEGGLYTRRYLRDARVAPVLVHSNDDCAFLLAVFGGLMLRRPGAPETDGHSEWLATVGQCLDLTKRTLDILNNDRRSAEPTTAIVRLTALAESLQNRLA